MRSPVILLMGALVLSSCSALWHAEQAMKKDPDVFAPRVSKMSEVAPVTFGRPEFSLILETGSVELVEARERGNGTTDSIRIEYRIRETDRVLTHDDSLMIADALALIETEVDCPDPEIIEVPVPSEPSFWERVKWAAFGFMIAGAILILRQATR